MITFCTLTNKQEESKSSHLSYHNLQIKARTISFYGEIMGAHGSITSHCPACSLAAWFSLRHGDRKQTPDRSCSHVPPHFVFIDLMSCCHAQCQSLATIKVWSKYHPSHVINIKFLWLYIPGHADRVKRRRQDGSGEQGNPSLFNLLVSSLVVAFILSL